MKNLLLTSLLALAASVASAETSDQAADNEWTVVDQELYMCDVLVSHYTPFTFEQVEDSFVSYYEELRAWYSPKSSQVYSNYQFNKIKWAECTSWFSGKDLGDSVIATYEINYQTSLSEDTIDLVSFMVYVEWVWNEKNDTFSIITDESKYINDEEVHNGVKNDTKLRKVLLETLEEE
jgi:hypothetical protein